MCSEWLKEESSSPFNSWKFHAISLSIIILELFSSNVSRPLEFLFCFSLLLTILFSAGLPDCRRLHLPSWGHKLWLKKWTLGQCKHWKLWSPSLQTRTDFQVKFLSTKRSGQGLTFWSHKKIRKETKTFFLIFQLTFLGTQVLCCGSLKSVIFPALFLWHRLLWLLGQWET